jgi:anti-sigma factor RsiW
MADHVYDWLGAYHDGELEGTRLQPVERHLADCRDCRAELEEIRRLSILLQDTDPEEAFLPADRFVANLSLNLPRRSQELRSRSRWELAWWLVPIGLLLVWAFIDITTTLSSAASFLANLGLLGPEGGWLQDAPVRMTWFTTAVRLFGDQLGGLGVGALAFLDRADLFTVRLLERLLPQLLLAAAYLGWLVAWWQRNTSVKGLNK